MRNKKSDGTKGGALGCRPKNAKYNIVFVNVFTSLAVGYYSTLVKNVFCIQKLCVHQILYNYSRHGYFDLSFFFPLKENLLS